MRYLILGLLFLLNACSFNKVSKIHVENKNNYPISVTIRANNLSHKVENIPSNGQMDDTFDWTNITKEDGEWHFIVYHANTKGSDSFTHGFFRNGELFSFVNLTSNGSQLKVEITE